MKKINIETFLDYEYVSNPRFSPNGKYIAFVSQKADMKVNGYRGDLYLIDEEGKVRRMTGTGDAKSLCWTENNTILFPANRNPELKGRTCFYELDPEGGEAELAFSLPIKVKSIAAMGDGIYRLMGVHDLRKPETPEKAARNQVYYQFDDLPFWRDGVGITTGLRNQLYIYDRNKDELRMISNPSEEVIKISHSGKKVIYSAAPFANATRGQEVAVYLYDHETGKLDKLLDPGKLWLRNCEVWGEIWGDKILLMGSDGKTYGRSQSPSFWLMDPKTREITLFKEYMYGINYRCPGNDAKLGDGQGMKVVGDRVYFLSTVNYHTYIRYLDKDGNISDYLTPPGVADAFDISGDRIVYSGFFDNKLCEIYEGGKQLSHMNDALLSRINVIPPEHQVFTNTDGYEIDGWVMKPIGYEPGKKYPVILSVHGGPRSLHGDLYFHEHQVWANEGYFVFFCNPRGSEGKGDDFAHIWGRYGTIDYQDLMEFTDEMLKRYPDADADRMGVAGGSYGGFMTNWIVGHTDRFKAAATQRCVTNYISKCLTGDNGYTFNFTQVGTTPWEDWDKMWATSPLKYAKNFKTPTLVIQSDADYCCWMGEGVQMYNALKQQGVPAKLCLFKGEGHNLSRSGRPKGRIGRMKEIVDWMNLYLK